MTFKQNVAQLFAEHQTLLALPNQPVAAGNGIYCRWQNPILTAAHAPLTWRYDFSEQRNPLLLERNGINAAFNSGAIYWQGKYILVVRVEANDRKSFFFFF